jgi:hypothetical protein
VGRTLLSAAFDFGVVLDLFKVKIKSKIKTKSSGQECPLHTNLELTLVLFLICLRSRSKARSRAKAADRSVRSTRAAELSAAWTGARHLFWPFFVLAIRHIESTGVLNTPTMAADVHGCSHVVRSAFPDGKR